MEKLSEILKEVKPLGRKLSSMSKEERVMVKRVWMRKPLTEEEMLERYAKRKLCVKLYQEKNKDVLREKAQVRYLKNREKRLVRAREYYQENCERIKALRRGRYRKTKKL